MTRLTTIGHMPPSQRQGTERQPTGDFAEALAKDRNTASRGRHASAKALAPRQVMTGPDRPVGTAALPPNASTPTAETPVPPGHPDLVVPGVHGPARLPIDSLVLPAERELLAAEVSPVGMTEAVQNARVFGVHLLAGCYLSEVSVRDVPLGQVMQSAGHALSDLELPVTVSASDTVAALVSLSEANHLPLDHETVVAMDEVNADAESRHTVETASFPGVDQSAGATEVAWSERILRITGEREGDMVAWLRDYRLNGGEEEKLVQSVLQEARAHGVKLAKIIVNGREAWTSREAI